MLIYRSFILFVGEVSSNVASIMSFRINNSCCRHANKNFQGQGSNPRKRAYYKVLKKTGPLNTVLQIHKWKN